MSVLPNFVSVKDHELSIEKGVCIVSFYVRPTESMANPIIVSLDASLQRKESGELDPLAVAYPFLKPLAVLKSGSKCFPKGSTIREGDNVDIEMDWTPSLHLTDAILNIALKIKECISQGEAYHPATESKRPDPVGQMVDRAKQFGSTFSKGIKSLTADGDRKKKVVKKKKPKAAPGEVRIGDEINMLEAPWVDCQGVYSCKAIRRPAFVDEAMIIAEQAEKERLKKEGEKPPAAAANDGEIPEDIGKFMQAQAGGLTKVRGSIYI